MNKRNENKKRNCQIYVSSLKDMEDLLNALTSNDYSFKNSILSEKDGKVELFISAEFSYKMCDRIQSLIKYLKSQNKELDVTVHKRDINISHEESEFMVKTEEDLKVVNGELFIRTSILENHKLNDVLQAQVRANSFLDPLKQSSLSPLEKYLVIYNFLTSKVYKENPEDMAKSRDLVSVLNGEDIVCVGYASLMKYLCDQVGIPCVCNHVAGKNGKEEFNHVNNVVCIDDDKYRIHGIFYSDSCWDATNIVENQEMGKRLNFCLIPVSDMSEINDNSFKISLISPHDENNAFFRKDNKTESYYDFLVDCDWPNNIDNANTFLNMVTKGSNDYLIELERYANKLTSDYRNIAEACEVLEGCFKKCGVKDDIYNRAKVYPASLQFETLLAMCLQKDNEDKVLKSIENLKSYVEQYSQIHKKDAKITKSKDRKISKQIEDYKYGFARYDKLKKAICNIEISETLFKYLPSKTATSPISVEQFQDALKNVYMALGQNVKEAGNSAEETVVKTISFAGYLFDEGAKNSFFEEYLKVINDQQK